MAQQLRAFIALEEDLDWVASTLMATQPSIHSVTGHPMPSDPKGTWHTRYTYRHAGKTLIHKYILKIKKKKKKKIKEKKSLKHAYGLRRNMGKRGVKISRGVSDG